MILSRLTRVILIIKSIQLNPRSQNLTSKMNQQNQYSVPFQSYEYCNQASKNKSNNASQIFSAKIRLSFSTQKQKFQSNSKFLKSENSTKHTSNKFLSAEMLSEGLPCKFQQNQYQNKDAKQKVVLQSRQKAIRTLQQIKKWRKDNIAPVDLVGCERLHDSNEPIQIQKYQILIALMLSVQTKDETTGKIMQKLKNYGLKPDIMSKINEDVLLGLIRQTNFNKRKTKNIIEASKIVQQYGLPTTKEKLMQFPGVGVKIATIYMRAAEGVNDGIGVDTHVHRISNRLGWVKNTKNPNETQQKLQKLFPYEYWDDINIALVGFGQILCQAKKPKCSQCPIRKTCPSSNYKQKF